MNSIKQTKDAFVLENEKVSISLSLKDGEVLSVWDKAAQKDIKGEKTCFFSFFNHDKEEVAPDGISFKDGVFTVSSPLGKAVVKAEVFPLYFTFTLEEALSKDICKFKMGYIVYNYDCADQNNTGAIGVAMTYWTNPVYWPDAKDKKTGGEVWPHLKDKGAKYALIVAPIVEQNAIMKAVFEAIDRNEGIVSKIGGAWGRDGKLNFGNYTMQHESSKEFMQKNLEFFASIGVDQVDFHQGGGTIRQGDFKYERYATAEEFRENVSDLLKSKGMGAGLHTYSHYIRYDCDALLAVPKWQKDLGILETFTLAQDVSAEADFLPTVESTAAVSRDYGFFSRNTPLILVGEEIMRFANDDNGFRITQRGAAGTKAVAHKKGEEVKHIEGYYHGACPKMGSELFLEVARNTAKAFNEGGFTMIYLDALDGISQHCLYEEIWYYTALFVHEILKGCDKDPLIEYSTIMPSVWAGRGRIGAYDTPFRSYKNFNKRHAVNNKAFIDRYSAPTMGWYDFYPVTDRFPGNEHTKYHHTDATEHLGSLCLGYNYSMVFNPISQYGLKRYAGMRRNVAIFRKYDELRKSGYFSEEFLQKLMQSPWEYHLVEKRGGKYAFVEKDYQIRKLYDLNDSERNKAAFKNPFGAQVPFVRIEALLSTHKQEPLVLLPMDENRELGRQMITHDFGGELNLADKITKTVRVLGNGKKGAVCIKMRCNSNSERGYLEFVIDTDYKGWREFVLAEVDNGDRPEWPFDECEHLWPIFRSGYNHDRATQITVETAGDTEGVKMSSVIAYAHTYEVLKNPVLTIGDTRVFFECELMSSDFIEFDGKTAKVIDRYGNEKTVYFESTLKAPRGRFEATLTARALNRGVPRAQVTLGFTGKEVKEKK
ncbi:MAG: hypothetical protein J6K61_06955 [Clostridia bacterium]|nr:hypothetical protein [Clostridia bacterium]